MKVITIHPTERKPDENVICELEKMLAEAKAGEIVGVALVGVLRDREVRMNAAGLIGVSMIGGMEFLKSDIIRFMQDDDD